MTMYSYNLEGVIHRHHFNIIDVYEKKNSTTTHMG